MSELTTSPRWNTSTKLVVALTLLVIVAGLLIKFESILPPLIIVSILAYLLNPVVAFVAKRLHISWKLAVTLTYAVIVLVVIGLLTISGVSLFQQIQNLLGAIQQSLQDVQKYLQDISGQKVSLGPFVVDLRKLDLGAVGAQLFGSIQPMVSRSGEFVTAIAGGAANFLGWTVFVLLVSYFFLLDSDGLSKGISQINIPGYNEDLQRIGSELDYIWNAFLRGQILIIGLSALIYALVLNVLGVNYAIGLALMAGLARSVPYIGSFTVWSTLFLVAVFQGSNPFGLAPWWYALIAVALAWLIDMIVDNFVAPNIMARALKVHPAAVLVVAIIALGLLGILGVIIAAPLLATAQLLVRYMLRKLFDLDPWEGVEDLPPRASIRRQISEWIVAIRMRLKMN